MKTPIFLSQTLRHGMFLAATLLLGACAGKEQKAKALVDSGQAKWNGGDVAGALADYNQAIEIQPDGFLAYFYRAEVKHYKGDLNGAVLDCNQAIKINPAFVQAIIARGDVKFGKGELPGAMADYTAALEVKTPAAIPELKPPSLSYALYRRGIVKQLEGDFDGALDDYDLARKREALAPFGNLLALYRHILFRRLGREPGDIAQTVAGWKDEWQKDIGLFLAGKMTEADFFAAAESGDPAGLGDRECQSTYFAGEIHLLNHDLLGAQHLFSSSVATEGTQGDERELARAELLRLSGPKN